MSKEIALSRGLVAIVDDEDFDWLNQWKWCALRSKNAFYAARGTWDGKRKATILMHREILGKEAGAYVDHRDNDGLNNQRANLRACTQSENSLNHGGWKKGKASRYKGVFQAKGKSTWFVSFRGKYVGSYADQESAARAYDAAALDYSPEFARVNFPQGGPQCPAL